MMPDFVLYAILAGAALAVVAGPLGSFVVWRRMSYFGETLSHAALMGIALGLLMEFNLQLSIIVVCVLCAGLLILLEKKRTLALDSLLGILAHGSLAIGIVLLSLSTRTRINLEAYLFGELLTISLTDLAWVLGICTLVLSVLWYNWNNFLAVTVHRELAQIEGINTARCHGLLILLMAMLIAVAMKIVGVLLITSLLIIPPAAARQLAKTPEQMAILASALGSLSVVVGLLLAFTLDIPAGPAIVLAATLGFGLLYSLPARLGN